MKKMYAIFGLALAMLTVGCAKDATNDLVKETVTFKAGIENSRTSLGELNGTQYPVLWSAGDVVAVNGVAAAPVTGLEDKSPLATIVAQGVAAPYSLLYPAHILGTDGNIAVATEQAYTAGSFAPGSAVLVGYAEAAGNVTLKNLYGFVKVTVNKAADEVIKSVTLTALGGESVSGTFAVDYKAATISPLAGKDLVRVSAAEGIPYVDGKAEVIIAVPAGKYAAGFAVKVADAAGKAMEKKAYTAAGVEVEAGVMLNMPALAYAGAEQAVVTVTTAAELQAALEAAAVAETPGHIVFGSDIDMTGATFASPAEFFGVLDGQGFAVKNWTTERGLVLKNSGVVKNIVIDESCTLTPNYAGQESADRNVAFVVEDNEEPGLVTGCVNYGKVIATDISSGAHRLGGVVGVSYGVVNKCINYGLIDVTSPSIGNAQHIGGVVGYANPNAGTKEALGKDILADCINYGEVKVLFPCQPKSVYVGGVLGATQYSKSSAAVYLGQIVNCVNHGAVSYRFETLSSGTYGNVGGVVGYSHATLDGCDNHGKVSFTTPAADLNQGGTRPAAGGVIGSCVYGVKNCNNYGELFVEGVWAAGTNDNPGAGSQGGSTMAGVVGCSGVYNVYSVDYPVENCNNYGKLDINNNCKVEGGTKGWHAGVVGYTTNDVKNCHNYAEISLKHNVYESYTAGVVGETKGGVYNCSSNAPVYAEAVNVSKAGGALYFAGIVGYSTIAVEDCHLNADFTAKTNNADGSLRFAGIVGQIKTASTRVATISNCTVKEGVKLTFTTDNGKANYCAGIIGLANNGISNCVNNGDIDIKVTELFTDGDVTYAAGVAAAQQEDMTGCKNNGNITVDMFQSTGLFYAATVLADNKKAGAVVSDCHNTGNLTIVNAGNVENVDFIVGHKAEETTFDAASCTNTGVVTVNGTVLGGGAAVELSIDGKRWALPSSFGELLAGVPTAVFFVDMGVTMPGKLIVALDLESVYGPDAAGVAQAQPGMVLDYTVVPTDATSGKVVIAQANNAGDVTNIELPYSALTENSVKVDFAAMGFGISVCDCTLFTKNVMVQ